MECKVIIEIITTSIAIIALLKGIYEYTKAQKWKKAEFVAKEIKEFNNDFNVQRAMIILDWNYIHVDLKPNEIPDSEKTHFDVDDDLFISALRHHSERPAFTSEEIIIRKIMDDFLFKLGMFQNYIDCGLITIKDIKPYLIYWIDIIGRLENGRKPFQAIAQLWEYIDKYKNVDVQRLCRNFGYKIN